MLAAFLTALLALTGLIIGINFIPDLPPQMMEVHSLAQHFWVYLFMQNHSKKLKA